MGRNNYDNYVPGHNPHYDDPYYEEEAADSALELEKALDELEKIKLENADLYDELGDLKNERSNLLKEIDQLKKDFVRFSGLADKVRQMVKTRGRHPLPIREYDSFCKTKNEPIDSEPKIEAKVVPTKKGKKLKGKTK